MNIAGAYLYCANLMTNNLRNFLFPIYYCLPSSSRIPIAQDTAGKMLISHVGEWWHVKQAEDFWHMVHIWGICHECLDHTACTEKAWRLFMGLNRQIPRIILYRWCMPLDWFCSNSVVYIALSKRSCQFLLFSAATGIIGMAWFM